MPEVRFFPATLHAIRGDASNGQRGMVTEDDQGRIPVALSSEYAVERYDWWNDERYLEVLDHSEKSIDLERAELMRGLPLLLNHDTTSPECFCGKVEDLTVDDDRKMRGMMRFSRSQMAQDCKMDVMDDLRTSVSIGYRVGDTYTQTEDPKTKQITRRYTDWEPLELSLVPVPADPTVGAGRAFDRLSAEERRALRDSRAPAAPAQIRTAPRGPEVPMPEPGTPAAPAAPVGDTRHQDDVAALDRINRVSALAREHGCTDKLPAWIENRTDPDAVAREIIAIVKERNKAPITQGPIVDLDEKTARRFSYARALLMASPERAQLARSVDFGVEQEIADDISKRHAHLRGSATGVLLPSMLSRAGLDSITATAGQEFKFTKPGEFIELLRNRAICLLAGARILPGLTGPLSMPRQSGAGTAYWLAENPGSDVTASALTTALVTLTMKTLMASTSFSKQLLIAAASGNVQLEQTVREDLAAIFALAIDSAALNGGGSNQPSGILQHTGIGSVTLGANGATITYGKIVDLETAVANANGDIGPMAYVTTPNQRGILKKTAMLDTTYSDTPVWGSQPDGGGVPQGVMNGYRAWATKQVPSNLTKGTSTTVCSAIIFGNFENVLIGEWGAFDVLVDPYTLAGQAMMKVVASQFVDVAIRQYAAFAAIKDALG